MTKGTTITSACTFDCPDACSLVATVEGGSIVRLAGDPAHPITAGTLPCARVKQHPRRLRSERRLTTPLLRRSKGAALAPVTWDEALDVAAGRLGAALKSHGPESILFVGGGGSLGLSKKLTTHFFCSLGAVTTLRGGICGEAGDAAQRLDFGDAASHDYSDLERSAGLVLWGKNTAVTGPHMTRWIKGLRDRGAPVVLIEPRPTKTAGLADRLVSVAPGMDGHLALAVAALLYRQGAISPSTRERIEDWPGVEAILASADVEEVATKAGTDLPDVEHLARLYGSSGPTATWIGWGLQRHRFGGTSVRWIDALATVSGNVGVSGGGVSYTSSRTRGLEKGGLARPSGRTIRAAAFGSDLEALDRPPVTVAYMTCANPVTQHAASSRTARALRAVDFVIVADAFLTDTAAVADLILPVSLMLEEGPDVVGSYQHHYVAAVASVVAPPEGVRSDVDIARQLSDRMGRPSDPLLADPEGALAAMVEPWFAGGPPRAGRNPAHEEVPFRHRFSTDSGRANLITEQPPAPEALARDGFPLTLLTLSCSRWQGSQLAEERQVGLPKVRVHPLAPGVSGLDDGAAVVVESPEGTLEAAVHLDEGMRRDVCVISRGGWVRCGWGVNVLVEERETDLGGGTAFYSQQVRISAV